MSPYMFTAAAIIAVIGILIVFKVNLDKIKEDPEQVAKAQSNFFIGVAIIEILPLIMIVFALIHAVPLPIEEIYIPAFIIIILMAFAMFFIFLQRKVDVEEDRKQAVNQFSIIAIALANAIPIIALVLMFINIV
ncbi:hypothetical protein [Oceanobacillus polygoni]|uniref:F0F1-type ATP synthase membrane subunit c/vacuolar-type H+-ATPase subunit K n=1 Tax=Oceanobacillus polygoni TaxID=1235259 RepID=A0A9X1CA55_9BACI|nr:hypothetical protein [Oceanobacillus polygoni]MBP2076179.1 F0F1-type ATP synthase membrane subunit c/vacuolar-type H+-ATPase subunit K [Oceanobacillus polygoni]